MANTTLSLMKTNSGGPTFPYGLYLGLLSDSPGPDGAATYELTQSGYARVKVDDKIVTPTLGFLNNSQTISFAAAGESWGKPQYWGIFTSPTAPSMAIYEPIAGAVTIGPGSVFNVHPGNMTLSLIE